MLGYVGDEHVHIKSYGVIRLSLWADSKHLLLIPIVESQILISLIIFHNITSTHHLSVIYGGMLIFYTQFMS